MICPSPFNPFTTIRYDFIYEGGLRVAKFEFVDKENKVLYKSKKGEGTLEVNLMQKMI
tara:strand:+ start:419 stop:592 length:174 start_codon:yes stop_codon:yes gene_type:complete